MEIKSSVKKLFGWLVKIMAIVAVPVMLPASVGVAQRVGWAGAVLVWMYMGRVMHQDNQVEE